MSKKLFLMSGCPGSGKSTFAKMNINKDNTLYVSRDEIRFGIVSEDEPYFSKENQVFNKFIQQITDGLNQGYNVIADATHLNEKSRAKLLFKLGPVLIDTTIIIIFMQIPLRICVERNLQRKGTRAYVPYGDLCRMYQNLKKPTYTECHGIIDLIYTVDINGVMTIIEKEN